MTVDTVARAWHRRRSELTHDWLRNRFLPRLRASESLMRRGDCDHVYDLLDLMSEWPAWSAEAARLGEEYCAVMSPARSIESVARALPVELKDYIRTTALGCWQVRHRIDIRLGELRAALHDADRRHACWPTDDAAVLASLAADCERVIQAFSKLPSHVRL